MAVTRVAKTAAATLTHTFTVGEIPTDSTTTVTVAVTDANGSAVTSGNATSAGTGTGQYTFALPPQSQLAALTVAWSATISGAAVVETDYVEIVGGFIFSLAEARASDPVLADANRYTSAMLVAARQEVEETCEWICAQAWVPRYRRLTLDGTGTTDIVLPDGGDELVAGLLLRGVRTIRSVTVAPRVGQTAVALTSTQLAALTVLSDGSLRRTDGNIWTEGIDNVIVEYEYGQDTPPQAIVEAGKLHLRARLNIHRSGVPDRAISFTVADGGTYRLSLPDAFRTGIPEVDGPYGRYSRRTRAAGASGQPSQAPASRTLRFQPQRYSLFHRNPY